jgi:hypothetical protein
MVKFNINICLPFKAHDLAYAFQMICLRGIYVVWKFEKLIFFGKSKGVSKDPRENILLNSELVWYNLNSAY